MRRCLEKKNKWGNHNIVRLRCTGVDFETYTFLLKLSVIRWHTDRWYPFPFLFDSAIDTYCFRFMIYFGNLRTRYAVYCSLIVTFTWDFRKNGHYLRYWLLSMLLSGLQSKRRDHYPGWKRTQEKKERVCF